MANNSVLFTRLISIPLSILFFSASVFADRILVKNKAELNAALESVRPGDSLILKSGDWQDVHMIVTCRGTKDQPIHILAEREGKVRLTGKSYIQIGGEYVTIGGLAFQNGYSPLNAIISFKWNKQLAKNCRLTNVLIDNYNKPGRRDDDYWIDLCGKENRVDHSSFIDKKNFGVLLAVTLDDEGSRKNNHSIDHNYFGRRLPLGSNSGEIIRVGVSQHCTFFSNTLINDNVFDNCDGEAEIISIKSCGNIIRNNVFRKSQGSLVLRHGNQNIVEGNLFLGMNKEGTGGVRIINENQFVYNNLFYQCKGTGFRSPLTIMNGVPNSPPHRYLQVNRAMILNNTFVECSPLSFGEGSDEERSAAAKNVYFYNNAFYRSTGPAIFITHDKLDSFYFQRNIYNSSPSLKKNGFADKSFQIQKISNLSLPVSKQSYPILNLPAVDVNWDREFGPKEYSDKPGVVNLEHIKYLLNNIELIGATWVRNVFAPPYGQVDLMCNNAQELQKAIQLNKGVNSAKIITLSGNSYFFQEPIYLDGDIIIKGNKKSIDFSSQSIKALFILSPGTNLELSGLDINLKNSQATHFMMTDTQGGSDHSNIRLTNSSFLNQKTKSDTGSFILASKSAFMDSVVISNCRFLNNSLIILSDQQEKEDRGIYNIERITIRNNKISNHTGNLLNIYRGGNDESTMGPKLEFINNSIENTSASRPLFNLTGVQKTIFERNKFLNCNPGKTLISYKDRVRASHLFNYNQVRSSGRNEVNQYVVEKGNVRS